jgi:hypothetical protein
MNRKPARRNVANVRVVSPLQPRFAMRRWLLLFLFTGCTQWSVEDSVDIERGLYGQLTVANDTGGEDGIDRASPIALYRLEATGPALVATATSDEHGVYQFEAEPGSYELCVRGWPPEKIYDQRLMNCAGPCTFIDFTAGLVRADWELNLSGGWWSAGEHCPQR